MTLWYSVLNPMWSPVLSNVHNWDSIFSERYEKEYIMILLKRHNNGECGRIAVSVTFHLVDISNVDRFNRLNPKSNHAYRFGWGVNGIWTRLDRNNGLRVTNVFREITSNPNCWSCSMEPWDDLIKATDVFNERCSRKFVRVHYHHSNHHQWC